MKNIFSRVLRDSTPRFVGPSVRPSITLYCFGGFVVFCLKALSQMIKWPQKWSLPSAHPHATGQSCIQPCLICKQSILNSLQFYRTQPMLYELKNSLNTKRSFTHRNSDFDWVLTCFRPNLMLNWIDVVSFDLSWSIHLNQKNQPSNAYILGNAVFVHICLVLTCFQVYLIQFCVRNCPGYHTFCSGGHVRAVGLKDCN